MIVFSLSVMQELTYSFPIFFAGLLSLLVSVCAILFPGFLATTFIIIMAILAIINSVLLIKSGVPCQMNGNRTLRLFSTAW